MRVILDISFDGRNINDVYNLPCVMAVTKDAGGKPAVILKKKKDTHQRTNDSPTWRPYLPI
jgi:hypothetical protein|nr:MAG TPA: hypothetical protein [Caudoviricetes sp.]